MTSDVAIVLTTFPVDGDVAALARSLVEERLAACVNVLAPMQSIYRWEGHVESAVERQLIIKTSAAGVDRLKRRLADLHPYELPELLVLSVSDGANTYLDWVTKSTV